MVRLQRSSTDYDDWTDWADPHSNRHGSSRSRSQGSMGNSSRDMAKAGIRRSPLPPPAPRGGNGEQQSRDMGAAYRRRQQNNFLEQSARPDIMPPDYLEGSLIDFLQKAMGLIPSGPDYGAVRSRLNSKADAGKAAIAAMYEALQGSFKADAGQIAQNYDETGEAITEASGNATDMVNEGYNASRERQSDQLQDLGIEEAAAVLAAQGGNAANDQAVATANIAQNQAANENANTQFKQSALNYNTGLGNAAQLEGKLQQAAIQEALADKLAEISIREQEAKGARFGQATSLAQMLYGEQQDKNQMMQRDFLGKLGARSDAAEAESARQQAARELALKKYGIDMGYKADTYDDGQEEPGRIISRANAYNQLLEQWKANGFDPNEFDKWFDLVK